jgi:hypothetical protein
MCRTNTWTFLGLTVVCWLGILGSACAAPPAIKDDAHVFSAAAVQRATREIEDLKRRHDVNLVIEFVPAVPVDGWWNRFKKSVLGLKKPEEREKFYKDWATKNARKAGPKVIYVLICKEPAPLAVEVVAGQELQAKAFRAEDAQRLKEELLPLFQTGRYDEGLLLAVRRARQIVDENLLDLKAVASSPWPVVLPFLLVIMGLWVCLEFLQQVQGDKLREGGTYIGDVGFGRGGSIPAGLFVAMNSSWVQHFLQGLRPGKASTTVPPPAPVTEENPCDPQPSKDEGAFPRHEFTGDDLDHHPAGHQDYVHGEP